MDSSSKALYEWLSTRFWIAFGHTRPQLGQNEKMVDNASKQTYLTLWHKTNKTWTWIWIIHVTSSRKKENRSMTSFELEKYLRKRQMSYYLDYCCIEKINFSSRYDTVIILILSKTTHHDDNFTCRLVQIFLIFIINLSFPYNMDNNLLCRG